MFNIRKKFQIVHQSFSQGFTLIEALVALFVFSASLVVLMTIAGRGISSINNAQQELVAHYLAQEGIELARNTRDTNFLQKDNWDDWPPGVGCLDGCTIKFSGIIPELSDVNPNDIDYYNGSSVVVYADGPGGEDTPFFRRIEIDNDRCDAATSLKEVLVRSIVTWDDRRGVPRRVELVETLLDWQTPATAGGVGC